MKFWKITLLSTLAFFAISAMVLYSACTVDTCADLKCKNGGACIDGYCSCPAGYEGADCSQLSSAKFVGMYVGNTQCDQTPAIFDTAVIYFEQPPLSMGVIMYSHRTDTTWTSDTLHGTINGANIIIPDYSSNHLNRHVLVTLDNSSGRLNIYDQEDHIHGNIVVDTTKTICNFYGARQTK